MKVRFRIEFRRHDLLHLTQGRVVHALAHERIFGPPHAHWRAIDAK
jgi:hypothetical protein